jgi:hypothetical protein
MKYLTCYKTNNEQCITYLIKTLDAHTNEPFNILLIKNGVRITKPLDIVKVSEKPS